MVKRALHEINAGSMADIAFLLLIFFLVTTTLDQDEGILRLLPPDSDVEPDPRHARDVFEVLVNANDILLVEGKSMDIINLKAGVMEFYTNPAGNPDLPQLKEVTKQACTAQLEKLRSVENQQLYESWEEKLSIINLIGPYRELPRNAVVSLQNDRETSYATYIAVQNELSAAVRQLRDDLSMEKFGVPYSELKASDENDRLKIIAVRTVYPLRISEAEPVDFRP